MTQKQLRLIRFILIIILITFCPFFLLNSKTGLDFFASHEYEYWLFSRLPFVLFPVIAYLGSKLNQNRIIFVSLVYWVSYILMYTAYTNITMWISLDHAISASAIALPLSLILVFYTGEGKIIGLKGIHLAAASMLPLAIILYLTTLSAELMHLTLFYISRSLSGIWHLPLISLPVLLYAVVALGGLHDKAFFYFRFTTVPCLVLFAFALDQMNRTMAMNLDPLLFLTINFTGIAALLLYTLYQSFWERAYIDELTGIPNRRTLDEQLKKIDSNYSLVMIDIDHFKQLNDKYGHIEGDNILRYMASHLGRVFGDTVFRFGGEEFCIIMEGIPMHEAAMLIDRFRKSIAAKRFILRKYEDFTKRAASKKHRGWDTDSYPSVQITFSAGLGSRDFAGEDPRYVIDQADQAMYQAKEHGRNRVFYYGPSRRTPRREGEIPYG